MSNEKMKEERNRDIADDIAAEIIALLKKRKLIEMNGTETSALETAIAYKALETIQNYEDI